MKRTEGFTGYRWPLPTRQDGRFIVFAYLVPPDRGSNKTLPLDAQLGAQSPKCLPLTRCIILSVSFHVSASRFPIYKMELIFTTRWNHKNCSQWLHRALKLWSKTPVSISSRGDTREPGNRTALRAALPTGLALNQRRRLRLGTAPPPLTDGNDFSPTVTATALPC